MMKFILGLKVGMSQIFDEQGNQVPLTVIESGICKVLQIKTKERDGYTAIQIGFKKLKDKKLKKTQKQKPFKYLREFRGDISEYETGQEFDVSIFKEGDIVKVSGISKGKGFAGVVKKWGFHGRPRTRGTKHEHRTIGSVGASMPPRVLKGKKMPGRMGSERVTIKNLKILKVDPENNLLMIKGAVPGRKGTLLELVKD
ncbi:MAG: 50S ribosomal protein L3 [Candidatus Nealsonbacteria bacterium]|nr:MAG: 50S ribosomal protein L3 [Candidatus Nealsonbacteria bacterium]